MNRAMIVTDLGYGDAGKGSMVDYLARRAGSTLVIRYNGGPQAAHNVVTPDGRHHTFAQVGSASFVGDAKTHLSRFMLVNPFNLVAEVEHLETLGVTGLPERITIDDEAMIITPWHVAANRLREIARGDGRHGSCGQGIGETRLDAIHFPEEVLRARDLTSRRTVEQRLAWAQNLKKIQLADLCENLESSDLAANEIRVLEDLELVTKVAEYYDWFSEHYQIVGSEALASMIDRVELTLFEGAQGVLLDENYGFHPHTTWSVTTQENALTLLEEIDYQGEITRLGLIRGYMVRHGAGPFVTEDSRLTAAIPDYHNETNDWQQGFRVGHLDLVALRYAIEANGPVDQLAVTNLDRMVETSGWQIATGYILPKLHHTSPYFTGIENGVARGIRVGPKNRRDYQEAITGVLLDSRPELRPIEGFGPGHLSYLRRITQELRVPVTYASYGPTARDKLHL